MKQLKYRMTDLATRCIGYQPPPGGSWNHAGTMEAFYFHIKVVQMLFHDR